MANCPDICTAEKCRELEERIEVLEQDLALLKAAFETHTQQDIPEAHKYEPKVDIALAVNSGDNTLKVFVAVDDSNDSETVNLPKNEPEVEVGLAANSSDNSLKVFVKVGDKSDDETVTLPSPPVNVEADIDGSTIIFDVTVGHSNDFATVNLPSESLSIEADINSQDQLIITVGLGEQRATDSVDLPQLPESKLNLSGYYQDGYLTLRISDGRNVDEVDILIPRGGGSSSNPDEPEETFLTGSAYFTEDNLLVITIDSSIGGTTFDVEIKMNDELLERILDYTYTIYKILGGGTWVESGTGEAKTVSLAINPEDKIKELGGLLYSENSTAVNELVATNLLDLINTYEAVNFYRNGFHRLPAKTLKSLINDVDGNQEITIYDAFSWQEYLIKQIDALVGEFPIKMKYYGTDDQGEVTEQDIELNNISVAIAEILALNLGMARDTDTAVNVGMKTLIEARNAANAAIVGVDYSRANAEYLGYKGNQVEREVKCTFTPKATNLKNTLKPSTQKIIGWDYEDRETLIEVIKKTLVGTEIIKAALFHPYQPGGSVTGDNINENLEGNKAKQDVEWEQFKQRVNNPSGRYQVPKPTANIRDLTIDTEPTP